MRTNFFAARRWKFPPAILTVLITFGYLQGQTVSPPEVLEDISVRIESYGVEKGLSQGLVYAVTRDTFGFIWAATKEGLNRFDGYEFKVFRHDSEDPTSLSGNTAENVFCDSRGRIWASITGGGLNLYNPKTESFWHFKVNPADPNGIGSTSIGQITEDGNGNVFFHTRNEAGFKVLVKGGSNEGAPSDYKFKNITELYPGTQQVISRSGPEYRLNLKFHSGRNELWVDTKDSVFCFDPDARKGAKPPLSISKRLTDIGNNSTNGIGFIEDPVNNELYLFGKDSFFKYDPVKKGFLLRFIVPDSFGMINRPFIDSKHRLWVQLDDNNYIRLDLLTNQFRRVVFVNSSVKKIPSLTLGEEDNLHNLWLGSPGYGICQIPSSAERFISRSGPDPNSIPLQGWTYCISMPGFEKRFDHKARKELASISREMMAKHPDFIFERLPILVARDVEGNYYANGFNSKRDEIGIYRFDPERREMKLVVPSNVEGDHWFGNPLFTDSEGGLWTSTGLMGDSIFLCKWEGEGKPLLKWKFPIKASLLGYRFIIDMVQDPDGTIWIGTAHGLFSFQPATGKWNHYTHVDGDESSLPVNLILCVTQDPIMPQNFIWLGTNGGGLTKLDKRTGKCITFNTADGLPNNVVYGVEPDFKHNLWLSTNQGICLFDPWEKSTRNFTLEDGLAGMEFNTYCSSHSADGEIWFGGVEGETHFDPRKFYEVGPSSRVVIHNLKINNKPAQLADGAGDEAEGFRLDAPLELTKGITLTHLESMVTIGFALMDLTHPNSNRFKYKLEGFNDEWIDVGTQHEATFTNLPAGTFTFSVMGCNSDGVWTESPSTLEIRVLPPWWRTFWFRASVLLSVALGLYLLLRYRFRKALELQRLRMQIARDLHDEIGSTLSSISIYSLAMAKSSANLPPDTKAILDKIRESTAGTMESMNDIVWTIDSKNDSYENIVDRMRSFAVGVTEDAGIALSFDADPVDRKLEMGVRKNIYLIFKEAVNNAVKYSGCKHLEVIISLSGKELTMKIRDDGKGFDPESAEKVKGATGGNGLRNMKMRAEECGGTLEIHSGQGKGTQIMLRLES